MRRRRGVEGAAVREAAGRRGGISCQLALRPPPPHPPPANNPYPRQRTLFRGPFREWIRLDRLLSFPGAPNQGGWKVPRWKVPRQGGGGGG
jgi:hypothetical protein